MLGCGFSHDWIFIYIEIESEGFKGIIKNQEYENKMAKYPGFFLYSKYLISSTFAPIINFRETVKTPIAKSLHYSQE